MPRVSLTLLSSPFTLISLQSCITMVPQLHLSFPCSKLKVEICLRIRQIPMFQRASSTGRSEKGHCPEPGPGTCLSWCLVHSTGGLIPRHCGAMEVDGSREYLLPVSQRYFTEQWHSIDAIRYSKVLTLPLAKFT